MYVSVKPKTYRPLYIQVFLLLRLACYFLLKGKPNNFFVVYGLKCSSFSKMNKGTSKRTECASLGFTDYPSVRLGNQLLERPVCENPLYIYVSFQADNFSGYVAMSASPPYTYTNPKAKVSNKYMHIYIYPCTYKCVYIYVYIYM